MTDQINHQVKIYLGKLIMYIYIWYMYRCKVRPKHVKTVKVFAQLVGKKLTFFGRNVNVSKIL